MRLRTRDDLREWIAADLARYDLGTGAARWVALLRTPQARWQVRLRVAEFAANQPGAPGARSARCCAGACRSARSASATRSPSTSSAPGSSSRTGAPWSSARRPALGRLHFHPGTSIGLHHGHAPVLEARVYVGPGAKVFGRLVVGEDAVIGANAVVTSDVAPGARSWACPPGRWETARRAERPPRRSSRTGPRVLRTGEVGYDHPVQLGQAPAGGTPLGPQPAIALAGPPAPPPSAASRAARSAWSR